MRLPVLALTGCVAVGCSPTTSRDFEAADPKQEKVLNLLRAAEAGDRTAFDAMTQSVSYRTKDAFELSSSRPRPVIFADVLTHRTSAGDEDYPYSYEISWISTSKDEVSVSYDCRPLMPDCGALLVFEFAGTKLTEIRNIGLGHGG